MGNLPIREQLKLISELIAQHKELNNPLEFQKKILKIQQGIDDAAARGAKKNYSTQSAIDNLAESSLKTKEPVIHFIDPSIFDCDALLSLSKRIVKALLEESTNNNGLKKLLNSIESKETDLTKFIEATLKEDEASIRKYAEELSIQPALLLYVISLLIQPYLQEVARKIDASFRDKWWQTFCPVCGRTTTVARIRERKRFLVCTFCGAEYLSDRFVCVHCGNKDPYSLRYLVPDKQPEFQIDFCTKCKHYLKVIDEEKLKKPIPRGLEEILTLNLDLTAKEADLERD